MGKESTIANRIQKKSGKKKSGRGTRAGETGRGGKKQVTSSQSERFFGSTEEQKKTTVKS